MNRRQFLMGSGLAGVGWSLGRRSAWAAESGTTPPPAWPLPPPPVPALALIDARPDRIVRITVCTRPFRAEGPRIEAERIGRQMVVHHYGHGGSGWSLSWGSAIEAARLVAATGEREVAVIGAGAIGLTTALRLQREGRRVRIYVRELPPEVRSTWATGVWSPDSRICLESAMNSDFGRRWESICRASHRAFQDRLGLPGEPITWFDRYAVSDIPFEEAARKREAEEGPVKFAKFSERVKDLTPAGVELAAGRHPFAQAFVRRSTSMQFNLGALQRMLVADFIAAGGAIEVREFRGVHDFALLPERTLVNCTGYGARALLDDQTVIPVRGQLALLIPQPEVTYGLSGEGFSTVPRRDGMVIQGGEKTDHGNPDVTPVRAQTDAALLALAKVVAAMRPA